MVKIRLRRMGTKARPFYRVVAAKSTAGRDSAFIENLGTYNPIKKSDRVQLNNERCLHWLLNGAQPTDTVAHMLKTAGVLEEFFKQRPNAAKKYKSLDKRTASMSVKSVVSAPKAEAAAPAHVAEAAPAPVEEAAPVVEEAPAAEAPAEEAAPAAE